MNNFDEEIHIQYEISVLLSQSSEQNQAFDGLLNIICKIEGIDSGGLYSVQNDGSLNLVNHIGLSEDFIKITSYYPPDSINSKIVNIGIPKYNNQLNDKFEFKSSAAIPIHHDGKPIACLNLASKTHDEIPMETRKLLESIAMNIGGAISRIKIEQNFRNSQQNFSSLFDTIEDFLFIIDENGNVLETNKHVKNTLGYSEDELKKMNVIMFHHPDRRIEASNIVNDILKGYVDVCLIPLMCKDGSLISVETKVVKGIWNQKPAMFGISRNTTERVNQQIELQISKDFSKNLIDTANVMIVGLNAHGVVTIFNNSAEKLTGYNKNEVIGKNWFNELSILSKRDVKRLNDMFNYLIEQEESFSVVENPVITKDGEIKYILWQNSDVSENGKVTGTISFGLDITDRRKFEEELIEAKNKAEKSDKMKLEFLANMSHDLRTPMNAIIGFSDLLKANHLAKNDKNDYINTIINNGRFLMALIDDIIDISKIDSGSLKIENADFELNKLMEELRLSYSKQIKDKNIEIIIDVDVNKNVIINSDKYRLRQILMNLIGNAIKFTNDGYVKFGYKVLNNKQLEIYVEDTGPGIERQYQRIIFERFKQIGTNNKFKGAGLGLSITKSLIELLEFKEIRLISELDKGSKFYFTVPYTIKHYNYISEIIKDKTKNKKIDFTGRNILVVEDNEDSRIIIRYYLTPTGANVIELSDGNKIMDYIKKDNIDLVILDIGLPGKNGYEVLKDIREYDNRLPVIIESALAMPDQRSKAFELGCDDFITKPFNREDFLNVLSRHI